MCMKLPKNSKRRVPVNPGLATVYPGEDPAEPRLSPVMPRWSPTKAGSVPADLGRATATPRFNPGHRR
ncbi:hypothetical protein DPMN_164361 [Dreissena polymorpha]|uniref:Uncharacterized protein n=1 Tax=Dreissena polymorpha TaxID=45954 RepID=A0A9D4EYF0_DREPO|nr:hypothetical protein DPMN_164361 [Dreissena polymorpha]